MIRRLNDTTNRERKDNEATRHALNTCLTVSTDLASMPTQSRLSANETTPHLGPLASAYVGKRNRITDLLMSPYEGLSPTTPQYNAGNLTDPPVSVPKAL